MRKFGPIYRISNPYIFVVSAVQVRPKRNNTVFFLSLVLVKPVDYQWWF